VTAEYIKSVVKTVPDYPKPGILFKDITPVLETPEAFRSLARHFVDSIAPDTTKLVAIESRGFILGAAIAQHINLGVVLVRKPGKLPRETHTYSYELEYGSDTLELHRDAIGPKDKVTIVDDVLATGGTAHATEKLCSQAGAEVLGSRFMMEIVALGGGAKLNKPYQALMQV